MVRHGGHGFADQRAQGRAQGLVRGGQGGKGKALEQGRSSTVAGLSARPCRAGDRLSNIGYASFNIQLVSTGAARAIAAKLRASGLLLARGSATPLVTRTRWVNRTSRTPCGTELAAREGTRATPRPERTSASTALS